MYKSKRAAALITAMILAVGSRGVLANAASKSDQGRLNPKLYNHAEDKGTYDSVDGI